MYNRIKLEKKLKTKWQEHLIYLGSKENRKAQKVSPYFQNDEPSQKSKRKINLTKKRFNSLFFSL